MDNMPLFYALLRYDKLRSQCRLGSLLVKGSLHLIVVIALSFISSSSIITTTVQSVPVINTRVLFSFFWLISWGL